MPSAKRCEADGTSIALLPSGRPLPRAGEAPRERAPEVMFGMHGRPESRTGFRPGATFHPKDARNGGPRAGYADSSQIGTEPAFQIGNGPHHN